MQLRAEDVTIAVTVFNRRQYLFQAIASALDQTIPARVIVVEDCGPDPTLRTLVQKEFGSRIQYLRNPTRRGLFANWNACLEYCQTPWISILHDDDFLDDRYIEAMLELNWHAPDCGLYFGGTQIVDENGEPQSLGMRPALDVPWRKVELAQTLDVTPFPFPGNLFQVAVARQLGGFRETSQYCGDWEMWCKLIACRGAAETAVMVAYNRSHAGPERGTSKVVLNGKLRPLTFVQQKRIFQLMRRSGTVCKFDRREFLQRSPMSIKYLLDYGVGLSPRLKAYHLRLVQLSTPPDAGYAIFRLVSKVFGKLLLNLVIQVRKLVRDRPGHKAPLTRAQAAKGASAVVA